MRRQCLKYLVGAFLGVSVASVAYAEDVSSYPSHPIRVIVPQTAGGGTDVACRMIANAAGKLLGQRLFVENRPGAGGRIGTALVAHAAPDGYTLLYTPKPPLTIQQHLKLKLDFNPEKDFTPIAIMTTAPGLLVVRPSFPAKTLPEFVAYAKAHPNTVTFGIQGIGSEFHVALEILRQSTGVQIIAVPYNGGAPAIVDLLAGRLDAMILVPAATKKYLASGRLRALATLEPKRVADFPDVPTVAEAGLPEMTGSAWFGFVAPARTPPEIISKLAATFEKLQTDAGLKKQLHAVGYTLDVLGPAKSAALISKERTAYGKIAAGGRLDSAN